MSKTESTKSDSTIKPGESIKVIYQETASNLKNSDFSMKSPPPPPVKKKK